MTLHIPVTPATLSPSWPLRWEAAKGKGRAHEDYILRTIAAEAVREETAIFMAAMNAADADAECRDEFLAEMEHLLLRAECREEFDEWRGRDWRNREDAEIGDWLARNAQPHMRDHERYAEALTFGERRQAGLLTDEELAAIAKAHRSFDRQERRAAHRRGEGGRI